MAWNIGIEMKNTMRWRVYFGGEILIFLSNRGGHSEPLPESKPPPESLRHVPLCTRRIPATCPFRVGFHHRKGGKAAIHLAHRRLSQRGH